LISRDLENSPLDSQNVVAHSLDLGGSLYDAGLLAQVLQPFKYVQVAQGRSALGLHVPLGIIRGHWQPGGFAGGESSQLLIRPVHRSASRISGVVHVVGLVAVAGLRVHGVLPGYVSVEHAQLLAVVGDAAAWQGQQQDVEEVDSICSESGAHAVLVVVSDLFEKGVKYFIALVRKYSQISAH